MDAIQEETELGIEKLRPVLGEEQVPFEIEQTLRQIVASAIDRGIELQRKALGMDEDQDNIDTPLRPSPSEPQFPAVIPPSPKLPKDVGEDET